MAAPGANKTLRAQLGWTCLGSTIIFACVSVIGIVWLVSYQRTDVAMETISSQFRKEQAKALGRELASLLRPLFTLTHRFNFRVDAGFADVLTTPTNHEWPDIMTEAIFPALDQDTHMRYAKRDLSEQEHNIYVAFSLFLALGPDNRPTTDLVNCSRAVYTAITLNAQKLNEPGQHYVAIMQHLNASGPGGLNLKVHVLDPTTGRLGQLLNVGAPRLRCGWNFEPLTEGYAPPGWWNFTWYGPYAREGAWGGLLVSSVPLRGGGGGIVGRISMSVSLGKSVGPLLRTIIQQGGEVTAGGQGAVFSESGFVIGLSEASASPSSQQVLQVEDLAQGSETGRAVALVREHTGTLCPETELFISSDDRLVDIVPFRTEDHGIAPLGERWCQLMTVPRSNVFSAIDEASRWGLAVGLLTSFGFVSALAMLGRSLHLTIQAHRQMLRERRRQLRERALRADSAVQSFGAPMAVIHLTDFLALQELECYEDLRNCHKLKFLDSLQDVQHFHEAGFAIALISHQWLGFTTPDTEDNTQLTAMKHMLQQLSKQQGEANLYIWLDYISVPQRHPSQLQLAVNSLPAYVSVVDYFLVCAPDALHRDTGMECNLTTYCSRGWCRLEMLAKASSSGLENMYICSGQGWREEELKPYKSEDFNRVSLKVFEGNFTVNRDKESLVEPILGLYGLIIRRSEHVEHVARVRQLVEADKEAFFPAFYQPEKGNDQQQQLFGPLVQVMEEHVASEQATPAVDI